MLQTISLRSLYEQNYKSINPNVFFQEVQNNISSIEWNEGHAYIDKADVSVIHHLFNDYVVDSRDLAKHLNMEHFHLLRNIDQRVAKIHKGGMHNSAHTHINSQKDGEGGVSKIGYTPTNNQKDGEGGVLKSEETPINSQNGEKEDFHNSKPDLFLESYDINEQNGQAYRYYEITKKGCLFIASKRDDKLTLDILNYLEQLEKEKNKNQVPMITDLEEALKLSLELCQKNKQLSVENKQLNRYIEDNKENISFAETIKQNTTAISIEEFAKATYHLFKVGRNKMFELLRGKKILTEKNIPYQRYMDLFIVEEKAVMIGTENIFSYTTKVRVNKQDNLIKLLNGTIQ